MSIKQIYVSIRHRFEMDIPDELLERADEGDLQAEQALDEMIYDVFIDSDWYFSDMEIK